MQTGKRTKKADAQKAIQITKETTDELSERMAQLKAIRQSSLQRCAQCEAVADAVCTDILGFRV